MTTSVLTNFQSHLEKYKEPGEINRGHFISCDISKIVPFQYVINREISRCFIFFLGTESSRLGMYVTLTEHLNLDLTHFGCSVATCVYSTVKGRSREWSSNRSLARGRAFKITCWRGCCTPKTLESKSGTFHMIFHGKIQSPSNFFKKKIACEEIKYQNIKVHLFVHAYIKQLLALSLEIPR